MPLDTPSFCTKSSSEHIRLAGEKQIRESLGREGEEKSASPISVGKRRLRAIIDRRDDGGFRIGSESGDSTRPRSHSVEPLPSSRAELNDLKVRELTANYARTGVPTKHAAETLKEHYLDVYLKGLAEPRRGEEELLSPEFREMAKRDPDGAIDAVLNVHTTLLERVGEEGRAKQSQERGAKPLTAKKIPPFFKNAGVFHKPARWTILDDWTVDTMKYQKNGKYRDSKKQVPYQDHIQPSDPVQRGGPSKRPRAQDIRELLSRDDFRQWLADNASERVWRVLEDLSKGETHSSIAKKHSVSAKTTQRMMSDFWHMVRHGVIERTQQYTDEFKGFIVKNGSDRQQRIMTALSENKTHSYIAEKELCATKTIQREVKEMEKMAKDAAVPIHASVIVKQVRQFRSNRTAEDSRE